MKKYFLALTFLLVGILAPILVIRAAAPDFALVAISPTGLKAVCVKSPENSVMSALQSQGFNPKQDDTGFIYSLIGYDGPPSSDPAAQQAFWGFWIGSDFSFSSLGPSQVKPENGQLYLFYFGDGSKPSVSISYNDVCGAEPASPPVEQTPANPPTAQPPLNQPATSNQNSLVSSFEYLRSNYANQSLGNQDWAAMALGSQGQSIETTNNNSESILSLSRNVLARSAQGLDRSPQVNKIKSGYRENQFGDPALINDDIFAVLALQSTEPAWLKDRQSVFETIIASQRPNGSFGFSKNGDGDVDMTAAAVWALVHKQTVPTNSIDRASAYLTSAENGDGGLGFKPAQASNVASSSWTLLAYRAAGKNTTRIESYLLNGKQGGGYWLFGGEPSYLNTAYAILALSGKKMPIVANPAPSAPPPSTAPKPQPTPQEIPVETDEQMAVVESFFESRSCSASASASASASGGNASASASASASCD